MCAYLYIVIKVRFKDSTYRVSESDGLVQPVLLFNNPSSTDITVHIRNIDNNATGKVIHIIQLNHIMSTIGKDYNSGSYEILFTAGQTKVSFNISIFEDEIKDDNEMFTLTIFKTMLPDRVSAGNPSTSTVIIADTTGQYLFKPVSYMARSSIWSVHNSHLCRSHV